MTVGAHVDLRAADHATLIATFGDAYTFTCEKSSFETMMGKQRTYTMWKSKVELLNGNLYVHVWDGSINGSSIL